MDRFLFRGRTIEGVRLHFVTGHYVSVPRPMIVSDSPKIGGGWDFDDVDPATIGQYTGLKDKNDNPIFEGDIVVDTYGRIMRVEYSVHFQQMRLFPISENCKHILNMSAEYGCEIFSWAYPEMHLKIIGNIHENPEMLETA